MTNTEDLATRVWLLEQRLAAAEAVAYLYGISPVSEPRGEREAALNEAWRQWWDHPGVPHKVKDWPSMTDEHIAAMAKVNGQRRVAIKAQLDKLIEVVPAGSDD